jgi:hypothetical protein
VQADNFKSAADYQQSKLEYLLAAMRNIRVDTLKELLKFAKLWNELKEHYTKSLKTAKKVSDSFPIF